MVTTPESSSNHHSPPPTTVPLSAAAGSVSGDGGNSPKVADANSPKVPRKNLPSPWAQVVRGGEMESTTVVPPPPPTSSSSLSSSLTTSAAVAPDQSVSSNSSPKTVDNSNTVAGPDSSSSDANDGNAGRSKKPAWNKPSNGVVEASPVMGAESWPALSKSTKTSGKLPPDSSSKTAADGSLPTSQGPVTSHSPQKQATGNARLNSATNHNVSNRQRSMKRGGGSSSGAGPAQSSFSNPPPPPPPPPFPAYQIPPVNYGNMVPAIPDPSLRDHYRNNSWDTRPPVGGFMPMNEHRGSSRRGNFGSHPRGDGSYHNNYGNRRDQDRGNFANTRDAHVHQPRMPPPRGLLRHPPPNAAAFVGPQPIGPFANPIGFPEFYYFPTIPLEHFRGMPFFTHSPPPAMFFPAAESSLTNSIVKQIDYYFSDDNLVKDEYLRSNMDEDGWVPITLIANFPRVKSLTSNIQLILESLRSSTIVEVQGDKLRQHNGWWKWVSSTQRQADSGSVSPSGSRYNSVAVDFQKITLQESTKDENPAESSS